MRAGRHPRPRPALPQRHLGDRRARWATPACTRCTPAPVTNVAAGTVAAAAASANALVEFAGSPDADDLPRRGRRLGRRRWRRALGGPGRLARLRHRRRRPARLLGLRAARSSPRSAACSPRSGLPGLRDPGGRLRARLAGRLQPRLRHRPARGRRVAVRMKRTGTGWRAGFRAPPRPDRRRDRPPARRALRDLPRSRRATRASTGSR